MAADRRGSSFLLTLGLAALLFSPTQGTEPQTGVRPLAPAAARSQQAATPAPSASTSATVAPADWCDERLGHVFTEYLGREPAHSDRFGRRVPVLRADAAPSEVLIATVPDPIDSGHDHYFDRINEAVQRAFGADEFLRDRSWLPWNDVELDDARDRVRSAACRSTHPGVVMYRPKATADRQRGALLLLVGESPTFGVHREALTRALALAQSHSKGPEIRIAGPVFSGSASSIRWTLLDWWTARPGDDHSDLWFQVISGSATGATVAETLTNENAPRITFQRTTASDEELSCAFYGFLTSRLGVRARRKGDTECVLPEVAMLSEGVTEYGGGHAPSKPKKKNGLQPEQESPRPPKCCHPAVNLAFPPNLSLVRTAYAASEVAPHDSLTEQLPRTRLSTSLRDERPPRDVEPSLSAQTTVARDLALAQILDRLAKGDVSYVGIVATDVNDTIFLASHIRKTSSDVRLFTLSSDILFAHPAYALDLKGMLVASAFPFFGANPFDREERDNILFSGDMDEGASRAVAALDSKTALPPQPVWITTISGGRVWPLSVSPASALHDVRKCDDVLAGGAQAPRAWTVFFIVCTAFAAFNGIEIVRLPRTMMGRRWQWSPLQVLRQPARAELSIEQSVHVFALAGLVATVQIVACWTNRAFLQCDGRRLLAELGEVVAVALVLVMGWSLVNSARRLASPPHREIDRAPAVTRLGIYVATLAISWFALGNWLHGATTALLAERMAAITSGVSPVAVLMSIAALGYVWTLCHLKRLHGIDAGQVTLDATPISDVLREGDSDLHRAERALCRALDRPGALDAPWMAAPGAIFWPVFGTLTLVAIVAFSLRPILVLEETTSGARLLRVAIVVSIAVLCATIARLGVFIFYLRAFLRRLRRHPILAAFSRLPEQLRRSVEAQTMGRWDPADIAVCIQLLETLAIHRDNVDDAIAGAPTREELIAYAEDARSALERELETPNTTDSNGARATLTPESVLGIAAGRLLRVLTPFWRGTARPNAAGIVKAIPKPTEAVGRYQWVLPESTLSWLQLAEELHASLVTLRLGRLLRQFRHFVTALISGALLLILAVSLYAFEPRRTMLGVVFFLTLGIAWMALGTLFLLDRDPVTSAIAGKPAGQVKWSVDLVRRVVTWGLIPILGAFAALYPEPTRVLFAWLDPIRRALNGSF